MPGIVKMENGGQDGAPPDHHKSSTINGINGSSNVDGSRITPEKGKAAATSNSGNAIMNGAAPQTHSPSQQSSRMNDLPEEIVHITQGFIPLSLLITRLAQTTHNAMQDKIAELAKLPVPTPAVVNGNSNHGPGSPDDTSSENIRKKASLLHFAQDMHAKWVKALVIIEWSRKASMVSKLIDLKFHIDQQRILYDASLDNIANVKRDLTYARMPSPDLKTALQILVTGTAPWMPDLQYIEPPALTSKEQLKGVGDLDTLLSLRLNLEDYDKIPYHFRNYDISSGRVTFKVPGEFEVDLTIADEDFEKQFWFIDFRYAFRPAASSLPESLRMYLEGCVNEALAKDGLMGCYQYLHEFVLTTKINELKRQTLQLSRTSWTGTLMVEPLNRALAIQYWTSRNSAVGLKSWVLVAVNSGRKIGGQQDPKSSSCLVAKWYRDSKEAKGIELNLDEENLSAESLLQDVVGRHIEFILASIHEGMLAVPRFKNRETAMALRVSRTKPGTSAIRMQVASSGAVSLLIEPIAGAFVVKPQSKFSFQPEIQLNNGKSPTEDGVNCMEQVRCAMLEDELNRRGSAWGWLVRKSPMAVEELKSIIKIRKWTRSIWYQREGWGSSWFVVVVLSLEGDEWWLLENASGETNSHLRFRVKLPLNKGQATLSDTFWSNLTFFTTGMISQSVDTRELHRRHIKYRANDSLDLSLPQQVRLPSIEVALSAVFPSMAFGSASKGTKVSNDPPAGDLELLALVNRGSGPPSSASSGKQAWADNIITIKFKGIQSLSQAHVDTEENMTSQEIICFSDAIIKLRRPTKFLALKGMMDRDVSYDPQRGEFSLRIRRLVTEPIIDALRSRIKAIDRFVNFLEAMDRAKGSIVSESVTMKEVSFRYAAFSQPDKAEVDPVPPQRWGMKLDLSREDIDIHVEKGNPHLRVADLIRHLVNTDGGIGSLMSWLPVSLPALQAIEKMDAQWEALSSRGIGRLGFSMKSICWMNIHYTIFEPSKARNASKCVSLDVRMRVRRNDAWWHISRTDTDAVDDEYSKALKIIWDGKGNDWLGLATGAAGKPSCGVVNMLLAVDAAIRRAIPGAAGEKAGNIGDAPMAILD